MGSGCFFPGVYKCGYSPDTHGLAMVSSMPRSVLLALSATERPSWRKTDLYDALVLCSSTPQQAR